MTRVRNTAATSAIRATLMTCGVLLASGPGLAQQRALTIDEIYDADQRVDFSGRTPTGLTWLSGTRYLQRERDPARLLSVDADTGATESYVDLDELEMALAAVPGMGDAAARRAARSGRLVWNSDQTGLVMTISNDLYYFGVNDGDPSDAARVRRLTRDPAEERMPTFSPDGALVAFVRDHNLVVVNVDRRREWALTRDGHADLLRGELDWVYQEEIYGRGNFKGFWWSPDSSRLAYLETDESPVKEFTVIDHLPYRLGVETTDYPKAGDLNPIVRLGVIPALGGETVWVDLGHYTPTDMLMVSVSWSPDSDDVVFQVQNREQTWLDLNTADAESGATTRLLQETTPAWVDVNGAPTWLEDDTFLWLSERSGWKHLYRYEADGTPIAQVTDGEWELRTLHGIDEDTGWVYFSGTERSSIGSDTYRIRLDGTQLTRLTTAEGTHRVSFSPGFSRYLDTWSDINTPPQVRVHAADGTERRVVAENQVAALANYRLSTPEFLQVTARDGFVMEAMMITPPDFDPSRRYPVFQHTYGGPHAQQVRNAWGGSETMFYQLLAQRGVIVWVMDNRTASGKGAVSTWPVYQHFGESELRDIEDGVAWLTQQPYVDRARIGIEGWSYGGFMTSYALTHSDSFVMGISGGTVSDWRDYDSIYTERFMRTPQNNPDGYRQSSPRFAAADLHGSLLLLHGTMDDNVHLQSTIQFIYELQKAGKQFELMLYPRSRHGIREPELNTHLRHKMLDFIDEHLRPAAATPTHPTGPR